MRAPNCRREGQHLDIHRNQKLGLMNFANPHFFSAILDGIKHRFILIQECESVQGAKIKGIPRFSVGDVNATKDPRFANSQSLVELGANVSSFQIPPGEITFIFPFQIIL